MIPKTHFTQNVTCSTCFVGVPHNQVVENNFLNKVIPNTLGPFQRHVCDQESGKFHF